MITIEDVMESTFGQDIAAFERKATQLRWAKKQIRAKFGPLPLAVRRRLEGMTSAQLEKLPVRIVKAKSLRELGLEE